MKLKKKFQESLIKMGGSWSYSYVEKHRLNDDVVYSLIRENADDLLLHYIKFYTLSTDQITEILLRDNVGELMLSVARRNLLTPKQQEIIVAKNNVLLFEAYLSPGGFFDVRRRFNTLPEYQFIYNIIKSEKLIGVEVFKTYVDNCYRTILSEDIVNLLIENENTFATQYIFHRARLKKEWEEDFIAKASPELLKRYIDEHEFGSDAAQLALVQQNYPLAQVYYDKYRLRAKAQQLYHEIRQKEIERKKADKN